MMNFDKPVQGLEAAVLPSGINKPLSTDAIDMTDAMVNPNLKNVEAGGMGVFSFFTILLFISIVYYLLRKFKEMRQGAATN